MKITKAIIPAAGLGTRFLPITKAIPKPMLPIVDKPTIQYIVEEAVNSGIKDIMIVVSPGTDDIVKHFTSNPVLNEKLLKDGKKELYNLAENTSMGAKISFAVQSHPNGLGDAVLQAENWLDGQPFALLLGDELIYNEVGEPPCIRQLADNYEKTGHSTVATMQVPPEETSKYGNLGVGEKKENIFLINGIKEKPQKADRLSDYAIVGRYVLSYETIEILHRAKPEKGEIYLTDAFNALISKGLLDGCIFKGSRFDAGDKLGYVKATVALALKREDMRKEVLRYIGELSAEK